MVLKINYIKLLVITGVLFINIAAFAQDINQKYVEQLEQQLFQTTYESEEITTRIGRLEEIILGESYAKEPVDIRVSRLQALMSPDTDTISQPNSPITQQPQDYSTPVEFNNDPVQNQQPVDTAHSNGYAPDSADGNNYRQEYYQPDYYEDTEVEDYPAVSYLEKNIFNETHKGEDVTKRLDRLETEIFNETRPELSLSERVDSLKQSILGSNQIPLPPRKGGPVVSHYNNKKPFGNGSTYYQDPGLNPQQYYQSPEMNTFQNNNNYPDVNDVDYAPIEPGYDTSQLSAESLNEITSKLEEQILGKPYTSDNLNTRLDRLEMQVFNRTATGYTPENRLERLVSVVAADQTSDPGDMKKINRLRKIQTGLTVGGLLFSILRGFLF
jgi:hypothetical protein